MVKICAIKRPKMAKTDTRSSFKCNRHAIKLPKDIKFSKNDRYIL